MMRTSLCMAAVALLCSTSVIAQTTGSTGSGPVSTGTTTQQPGTSPGQTMPETTPGQSDTMGSQPGSTMTPGSEEPAAGTPMDPGMQDPSTSPTPPPTESQGTMGTDRSTDQGMGQDATTGQSTMGSASGQSQDFAAFDLNKDGSLDRTEFARALQVSGAAPAAGGTQSGVPSRQSMRGDRAISPLNQSSIEFQRLDTNGDGKISQEEFSGMSSPQQ